METSIQELLSRPFPARDIEWLAIDMPDDMARAAPYLRAAAIERRLDEAAGSFGWSAEFREWHEGNGRQPSQLCGISILDSERKTFVTKWDGAENTAFSSVKGGLSAAFKRAASKWGIGRYLRELPFVRIPARQEGKAIVLPPEVLPRLDATYEHLMEQYENCSEAFPAQVDALPNPNPYLVRQVKREQFGYAVTLTNTDSGKELTVLTPQAELAVGARLSHVNIQTVPAQGNIPAYHILQDYQAA